MVNLSKSRIKTERGTTIMVDAPFDQGSQGILYSDDTGKYLIKVFYDIQNLEQIEGRLKALKQMVFPPRFICPIDIVDMTINNERVLGYTMLKVENHIPLNRLLIPSQESSLSEWYNKQTGGLYRRIYLGYLIAMNFYLLHRNNIAYCDISGNNILVSNDVRVASVCMIDIDNLYIPGINKASVLGTSRYMAPEIINRQLQPDVFTDDYSLSVILFELLKCGHPYIGDYVQAGTPELEYMALRGYVPYVEDPKNAKNRSTNMLPNSAVFNDEIEKLFERSFVIGNNNRMNRPTALEYALAFQRASKTLIRCKHCGAWYFPRNQKEGMNFSCPWCDKDNAITNYALVMRRYPHFEGKAIGTKGKNAVCAYSILLDDNPSIGNRISISDFKYSLSDEDIAKEKNKIDTPGNILTVAIVKKSQNEWKIKNVYKSEIYLRKRNSGPLQPITKGGVAVLNNGDAIYLTERREKDEYSFDETMRGDSKPQTFVQFVFLEK